jgi:phosphoribosylformylglycinamidine synthase
MPEIWSLEVRWLDEALDPGARPLRAALAAAELPAEPARHRRLYLIDAPRTPEIAAAAARLCADPLLSTARAGDGATTETGWTIDVLPLPGVTDAEGDSLAAALARDGFGGARARAGRRYLLPPGLPAEAAESIARRLAHPVVEQVNCYPASNPPPLSRWGAVFVATTARSGAAEIVSIRDLDDATLAATSRERLLALPLEDMRAVRDHFRSLGRDPSDVELETIAQTWSEHCAHRTFKATILHREPGQAPVEIRGLLRTFIAAATAEVDRPWVRSAFVDNAGAVAFDRHWDVSFKVETHNHPSAIEPFGGANTGVGGVVRDILGVSAEPIANTDVLCFGPLDLPAAALLPNALPPREVYEGVVAGIADYGNKMGIPTVNGATLFDRGYAANPLVFCGTVGLAPRDRHPAAPRPGDLVVVAGGRAGRDGIHGATFSSTVIDAGDAPTLGSVVQIGDPIVEKRLADALPRLRDEGLYTAITDCGAGGLSSAVGEMARELGAEVDLARVLLKYPGLRPWEIWLSEAQERLVFAMPPEAWPRAQEIFAAEGVEATVIGAFTGDGHLRVRSDETVVADLDGAFLHDGMPTRTLESVWAPPAASNVSLDFGADLTPWLLRALADPNVASKEAIVRQYDHEVQGRTVGKPFVGPADLGPADAAVLRPLARSRRGVAIGCGINPWYGEIDPYAMALLAVDEALRNVTAVGADPDRTALLDNFCWGDPNRPDRLGGLVRAARGCHDAAVGYRAPFISGKDSLFNEYRAPDGTSHAIPGTLLISAIGIVPDVGRIASMHLREPGNFLYLVGRTADELGGSLLLRVRGERGGEVPRVEPRRARSILMALHRAIRAGLVQACHDLSEGGLAVAAAEMAIASGHGAALDLGRAPGAERGLPLASLLFAESATRFLVEVRPDDAAAFERRLGRAPWGRIGRVMEEARLTMRDGVRTAIDADVSMLRRAWRTPLGAEEAR